MNSVLELMWKEEVLKGLRKTTHIHRIVGVLTQVRTGLAQIKMQCISAWNAKLRAKDSGTNNYHYSVTG